MVRFARHAAALALAGALAACVTAPAPRQLGQVQSGAATASLAAFRAENNLAPLTPDPALERAAATQAGFMRDADAMEHTTGWSRDFASRMTAAEVHGTAAENIAHAADLDTALALWANSAPHRRNTLDPRFSRFGLASAPDGAGKRYWALVLGR